MTFRTIRPFLLTLTPLFIAAAVYFSYWRGEADKVAAAIESELGVRPEISGFPYRITAALPGVSLTRGGADLAVSLTAGRAEIDRGPLRGALYVGAVSDVQADIAAPGMTPPSLQLTAPRAAASLRASNGKIDRLSVVAETARLASPLWRAPLSLSGAELHFRETPNAAPASGPTPPGQAEAKLAGTAALPGGAVITLSLPISITADRPLRSMAEWRGGGGTVEISGGQMTGPGGAPFAGLDATLVPLSSGQLALAGSLTTDCPLTAKWLFGAGAHPGTEFRRRRPAEFALTGSLAAPGLSERPTPSGGLARNQEPPCPDLRR